MSTDKALANSKVHWTVEGGDTGKRRAECMSFLLKLRLTHHIVRSRFSGRER